MNGIAMNRTVGREELQYIIANITEHNLEDEASFYSFGVIMAVSLLSLTIGSFGAEKSLGLDWRFGTGRRGFPSYSSFCVQGTSCKRCWCSSSPPRNGSRSS